MFWPALVKPVVILLKRMKFLQKFAVFSIVFIIPLIYCTTYVVLDRNQAINSMELKYSGLQYLATLRPLAEHIAQTRGMTNAYLKGNTDLLTKIEQKRKDVNAELKTLIATDKEYGTQFKTGDAVLKLQQRWKQLSANAFVSDAPDVFSEYTKIINSILALKIKVAESSTLLLHDELDGFYLVESLVKRLPIIAETIGKSRGLGAGIAASKTISSDEALKLSTFINAIKIADQELAHGLNIVFENNIDLKHKLESQLKEARNKTHSFILTSEQELLNANNLVIESSDYFNKGTSAISANLKLYDLILPNLNNLLTTRIDALIFEHIIGIVSILLIILTC